MASQSKTPIYYVCGKAKEKDAAVQAPPPTKSKSGIIVFPDVWGLKNLRTQLICDTFASSNNCHHVVLFDPFRGETKADHDDMVAWLSSVPYEPNVADDVGACIEYLIDKGVDKDKYLPLDSAGVAGPLPSAAPMCHPFVVPCGPTRVPVLRNEFSKKTITR